MPSERRTMTPCRGRRRRERSRRPRAVRATGRRSARDAGARGGCRGARGGAASLGKRSIKKDSKLWALDLAIRCTDLTTLEGVDTPGKVEAMCARPGGPTTFDETHPAGRGGLHLRAARAGRRRAARGSPVRVASVAGGFPAGLAPLDARLADIRLAVDAGADEVDIVLNRSMFLAGDYAGAFEERRGP